MDINEKQFWRNKDAEIMSALHNSGMGDDAEYQTPDQARFIPCKVFVDRGITLVGEFGQAIVDQITVTCFLSEISCRPEIGGRFCIDREVFTVDSITAADVSRIICVVKVGK